MWHFPSATPSEVPLVAEEVQTRMLLYYDFWEPDTS